MQVQFPSPAATDYVEGRLRTIPTESPDVQYSTLERQPDTLLEHDPPSNSVGQQNDLEGLSVKPTDANDLTIAPISIDSRSRNLVADSMIDFENLQFDDESFLEDILLCQFSYNPPGLTVASSPVPDTGPAVNLPGLPDDIVQLDVGDPPNDTGQKVYGNPNCAVQITTNELEVFHAKLMIADVDGTLANFQKPSLSRSLRCIIAYFQHFDPHAPFIHYASFSISTEHRMSPSIKILLR